MLNLQDREWGGFLVSELFTLVTGKGRGLNHLEITGNGVSYLGATNRNNGVLCMVKKDFRLIQPGNCIAFVMNGEGSIGYSVYKAEPFIATSDITLGYRRNLNKYIGIFISTVADTVRGKYSFNYKRSSTRLARETLHLPVAEAGVPDWDFMEQYIREREQLLLNEYREHVEHMFQGSEVITPLTAKEWGEFAVEDLFSIAIGQTIDGNKVNLTKGKTPYITRKENNNGLSGFIDYDTTLLNSSYPVITIGNETASPYVQVFPFFTGTKVNILTPKKQVSSNTLIFVAQSLRMHRTKYSYSFTINSTRLRKQLVLLPVTADGSPDWDYMEQYVAVAYAKQLQAYLEFKKILTSD